MQFVISHGQRFRQHQPAFIRNIEGVKRLRVWIVDVLGDKFPGGKVFDLKAGAGHGNDISRLCITFFHFQPGRNSAVVQDIAVRFPIGRNKDCKVRHKPFSVLTGNLMYGIVPVRELFGSGKSVAVRCEQVALAFLRVVIAACCF